MRHINPCRANPSSRTAFPRRKTDRAITKRELGKLAQSGRKAIEHLLLCILMRPRITTEADIAELNALGALFKHYNDDLSAYLAQPGRTKVIDDTNKSGKWPAQSHENIYGEAYAQ